MPRWLLACLLAATPAVAAAPVTGTWFGTGQPGDRSSMYVDRLRPNGEWRGEYRTCIKGKPQDSLQTGHWSLAGDILSLNVETVDGALAWRTDHYKMLSRTPQAQVYVTVPSNFRYTPQRMADNFKMPDCDLVS